MHRAGFFTTLVVICLGFGVFLHACGKRSGPPSIKPANLTVFAAASLKAAYTQIGKDFETANPGSHVTFSFAGSNQLRLQLESGAPADLFASADTIQMDLAVASKVVDKTTVTVFARNQLIVILPKNNPAGLKTLADLAKSGIRIVLADKAVPVGNYTAKFLDAARAAPGLGEPFPAAFEANVVSREQSVAGVVTKVRLGEADAGVAYVSDAAAAAADVTTISIPSELNQIAEYPIGLVAASTEPAAAKAFIAFLTTPDARRTIAGSGFLAPGEAAP